MGTAFAGNIGTAGNDGAGHFERQAAVLGAGSGILGVQAHTESRHDIVGRGKRPVEQGLLPRHPYRFLREGRQQRHHKAREEAGLAGMEFFQLEATRLGCNALDGKEAAVHLHLGSQGAGYSQGALIVSAGRIATQVGSTIGQGRGNDGPLGKALGRRHGKTGGLRKTEAAIDGFPHVLRGPLTRGGGLGLAQAGVGERCAVPKGFQAAFAAFFAHAEGYQRAGLDALIEVHYCLDILRAGGGGDYLHHFPAKAARTFQKALQHGQRRRPLIIMVRADEHGPPFAAGFADAPAHGGGCLHLQVYVFGAGLDGPLQDLRSLRFLGQSAGGDERHVRVGEQTFQIFAVQGAAVQADFGHFQLRQQIQDLLQFLILYGGTNHRLGLRSFL